MRRYVALIAFAVLLSACTGKEKVADQGSITPPPGWQEEESYLDNATMYVLEPADTTDFPTNINVVKDMDVGNEEAYLQEALKALENGLSDFYLVHEEQTKLGTYDAWKRDIQFSFNEAGLHALQYTVFQGGNAFIVTFISNDEEFSDLLPEAEESMASLTLS